MMSWWKWPRTNGCVVKLDFWCFSQYLEPLVWYLNVLTPVWRGSVVNQSSYQYHSLSTPTLPTMPSKCLWKCLALINDQLIISWWFGARWFGFLGSPCERDCYLGLIPKIIPNRRAPNHQFTISWNESMDKKHHLSHQRGHGSLETLPTESCPETLSAAEDHPRSVPKGGCIFLKASHIKQRLHTSFIILVGWMVFFDIPNTRQSSLHVVQTTTVLSNVWSIFSSARNHGEYWGSLHVRFCEHPLAALIWQFEVSLHLSLQSCMCKVLLVWNEELKIEPKKNQPITYAQQGRPAWMMMNS